MTVTDPCEHPGRPVQREHDVPRHVVERLAGPGIAGPRLRWTRRPTRSAPRIFEPADRVHERPPVRAAVRIQPQPAIRFGIGGHRVGELARA